MRGEVRIAAFLGNQVRRVLQLDDILPDGPGRLVCSRRFGLANPPPTIAITLFPIALTPKNQKPRLALGNPQRKPFIMAIAKKIAMGLGKPFGLAKQSGMGLVIVFGAINDKKASDEKFAGRDEAWSSSSEQSTTRSPIS